FHSTVRLEAMDKRILIVDDSAPMRKAIRGIIDSKPGLQVCGEARDGVEGVEKGQELKPDVILLDFAMPGMNGLQAAGKLRKYIPSTPVILVTCNKECISASLARDAGVACVVSKSDVVDDL